LLASGKESLKLFRGTGKRPREFRDRKKKKNTLKRTKKVRESWSEGQRVKASAPMESKN